MYITDRYQTTPCLVLDEIDAALDNSNIGRIADYLSNQNFQTIAISHRPEFYQHANGLIGITSDVRIMVLSVGSLLKLLS